MKHFDHERLPEDLDEVGRRLRAGRRKRTALELDQIKQRAMEGVARGSRQGSGVFMRSKLVTMLLVLGLAVGGGGAGVIAKNSGGGGNGGGGNSQYKPGKGCGDKNHTHTGPPGNPSNTDCPNK